MITGSPVARRVLVCWCPSAAKFDAYACKMRQSIKAALVLCTAAAFAPQQHATRSAVKVYSSVKPSAGISFYEGLYEPDVPDVKLTRSKDGENGVATFNFDKPSFFNCEREEDVPQGAITAMTMEDEEGEISTANVSARFVEGKPVGLLVRHEMRTPGEWDRFMRFMERYAEANGLGFAKA